MNVYLDPGHGGNDSGAVGNGLLEKNVNLQIALSVREFLNEYENVSIRMSRTNDRTVPLHARTSDANRWGADFYLSIHVNAGGGTGFETYIYRGLSNSSRTARLRNILHDKVAQASGLRDRGKKQANFHVLRETNMSAILTENGFIDTAADAEKMKQQHWIEQVAEAHAEGIAEMFNLQQKSSANVTNSSETERYVVTRDVPGYYTANDAKIDRDRRTTVKAGTYYVFNRHDGMLNVTRQIGTPGSWINPSTNREDFQVGDRVTIKQSATTYATGESIPAWVKARRHTIQQVASERVLLREIYSWVRKTDIET